MAGFGFGGTTAQCVVTTVGKLVVMPTAVWFVATVVLHLEPLLVAVATLAAAMPTGTNVYIIARRYDVGVSQAAGAILMSTLLSALG